MRIFVFIILCGPHLMLANLGNDDGIALGYIVNALDDGRSGQNLFVVLKRIHILHALDMSYPLIMVLRI